MITSPWAILVVQALNFFVITLNFRACAKGMILATIGTDVILSVLNFAVISALVEARTLTMLLGYATGSAIGSTVGMLVSRGWADADRGRA